MTQLRLLRFGAGDRVYLFPSEQDAFKTNFGNLVPRTTRMPGMDGGYNENRGNRAASEIGNIQASWWLLPQPGQHVDSLKDAVNMMADWGEQRLYIKPYNSALPERWCYAQINNIDMSEKAKDMPELRQRVTVTWQVPEPFFYNQGNEAFAWDDGTLWDGGAVWDGAPLVINAAGVQTDTDVMVGGAATTFARIVITVPAGKIAQNITIRRIISGIIRDEIIRTGTLTPADIYEINPRRNSVTLNTVDAFNNTFDFKHPDWMRLEPGKNRIRVQLANPSDEATVKVYWFERYR